MANSNFYRRKSFQLLEFEDKSLKCLTLFNSHSSFYYYLSDKLNKGRRSFLNLNDIFLANLNFNEFCFNFLVFNLKTFVASVNINV